MSTTITQLTPQGLTVAQLEDRIAQLSAAYQAIFGVNINLDPNSIDGQTTGITAASFNDLDQLAEAVYQSFNPATATGAALSRLVQLNGITRNLGSYSSVTLRFTGDAGTVVPYGTLVRSADGASTWTTLANTAISFIGTVDVLAQCTVPGPVQGLAGTLTQFGTYTYGVQSVTNLSDAAPGAAQETDEELRLRRAASTATSAQGIVESLYGALSNLTGVTQAQVYENFSDVVDANGLAPHSIYAVVLGGDQQAILNTIWLKKSAGVGLAGSINGTILDSYGSQHPIHFDRPFNENIYVAITLRKLAKFPTDGVVQMQNAIVQWAQANQRIGDPVILNELYTPINTVPGISVASLTIGSAPLALSASDITIPYNAIATFLSANISITVL